MQTKFEGIVAQELINHVCMLGEIPFSREERARSRRELSPRGEVLVGGNPGVMSLERAKLVDSALLLGTHLILAYLNRRLPLMLLISSCLSLVQKYVTLSYSSTKAQTSI